MGGKKTKKELIKAVIFDVGGVLALGKNSQWRDGKVIPSGVHEFIAKKLKISLDQYLDSIDITYALAIEGKISNEKPKSVFPFNYSVGFSGSCFHN